MPAARAPRTTRRMRRRVAALALALPLACPLAALCACDPPDVTAPPSHPVSYTTQNNSWTTYVAAPASGAAVVSGEPPAAGDGDGSRVLVLETTHLDRPAEVVGVVDVHERMASTDEALAELRRKAARLGADAVVGVEFHHGEGEGEPTHLSGLAVRYREDLP